MWVRIFISCYLLTNSACSSFTVFHNLVFGRNRATIENIIIPRACPLGSSYQLSSNFGVRSRLFQPTSTLSILSNTHSSTSSGPSTMMMMRHGKKMKKLNRPADQRKALLRGLTTEVIRHGRIKTNFVRAMVVRGKVDHMIQLAKRGTLHARRQVKPSLTFTSSSSSTIFSPFYLLTYFRH